MKKIIEIVMDGGRRYPVDIPTEKEFSRGNWNWTQDTFKKFSAMTEKQVVDASWNESSEDHKAIDNLKEIWKELKIDDRLTERLFKELKDAKYSRAQPASPAAAVSIRQLQDSLKWVIQEIKSVNDQLFKALERYLYPKPDRQIKDQDNNQENTKERNKD